MHPVDDWLSDGTLTMGSCGGFSESHTPPGDLVGFINPRTDPERDEDRVYPKKKTCCDDSSIPWDDPDDPCDCPCHDNQEGEVNA